jgi:Rrf2 family nitric oxide-sensitive transcriptional repressor
MQLTRFTDYSLRVLIYLSAYPDRLCTIAEIAESYGVSENHLMKVVSRLSSTGYVESVRGKGGGIRLARPPNMINLGAVVRDTEERFDIVECFNEENQHCPLLPACTLKSILHDASRNFLATLDRHTIQDVLGNGLSGMFSSRRTVRLPIKSIA